MINFIGLAALVLPFLFVWGVYAWRSRQANKKAGIVRRSNNLTDAERNFLRDRYK